VKSTKSRISASIRTPLDTIRDRSGGACGGGSSMARALDSALQKHFTPEQTATVEMLNHADAARLPRLPQLVVPQAWMQAPLAPWRSLEWLSNGVRLPQSPELAQRDCAAVVTMDSGSRAGSD
jgi:hypothetical protein